jgi:hypothetical protein
MFARSIAVRLKPNSVTEFMQTLQNEIDPVLREEQGFRGHIAFVVADGTEAVAISFWDRKQGRISHSGGGCDVLATLAKLVKGPPDVRVCEISNSTSDNGGLLRSFVHVEGVPHIEIYEVSRSIFRAIAAEGQASDHHRDSCVDNWTALGRGRPARWYGGRR